MSGFFNIIYVLSNHANESSSFHHAISLAKLNQANLTLLKVLPDMPSKMASKLIGINEKELQKKVLKQENANMQRLVSSLDTTLNAKAELRIGKKYIETIRAVQAKNYDLVIKEVDDIDWIDRLFGGDDMCLLRECPCPVWIMKKTKRLDINIL